MMQAERSLEQLVGESIAVESATILHWRMDASGYVVGQVGLIDGVLNFVLDGSDLTPALHLAHADNPLWRIDSSGDVCKIGAGCGDTCIARGKKCKITLTGKGKQQITQLMSQLKTSASPAKTSSQGKPLDWPIGVKTMAIAAMGMIAATAAAKIVSDDLESSSVPFDSIRQPPGGKPDAETLKKYDGFKPGSLIRKNFKSDSLGNRQHYGVYIGKDPVTGDHMTIDTGVDWKTRDQVPYVRKVGLTWDAGENDSEWEMVPDAELRKSPGPPISGKEAVARAEKMLYSKFRYQGFSSNCESFARAIVEGESRSAQEEKVSPLTRFVSAVVTDNMLKLRTANDYFPGANEEPVILQVGPYKFTGLSAYAQDPETMTAQEMAAFLRRDRVREARQKSWGYTVNPYTGKGEELRPALPAGKRAKLKVEAVADFDDFWGAPVVPKRRDRTDSDSVAAAEKSFFSALGLRAPSDYAEITEKIAAPTPELAEQVRIQMYQNYLMLLFSLLSTNNRKLQSKS